MNEYVMCPHCGGAIEIVQVNCGIFRHGIFKHNQQQIDPHAPKNICDKVFNEGLIYGCGKPFKINKIENTYFTVECDYI